MMLLREIVPILIDPKATSLKKFKPFILIDARLLKRNIDTSINMAPIVIGLGPGFTVGENCHAAVETKRGENIGQVIYKGSPQTDTGRPAPVKGITLDRVLRSPASGIFKSSTSIGDSVNAGDVIADVDGVSVASSVDGVVRGLARNGLKVSQGQKIGDIDPRGIRENCFNISKKALAIAEGVLKAIQGLTSRISD
jgi:xanthine dehydrogenase accessory factor